MNSKTQTSDLSLRTDQSGDADTLGGLHKIVATLRDVNDALESAARSGTPNIADWPHRVVDFRILKHILCGLDRPVEVFETLLPVDWKKVSHEIRDRIPGNRRTNHMRLASKLKRAIGLLRPDIDPWSALQLLIDVEIPTHSGIVGEVRWRVERDGIKLIEIDSVWIAKQLIGVSPENEKQHRSIYQLLVRLSKRPLVQRAGLLRADLALPATIRQHQRTASLPDWLQAVYDVSGQQTRNALDRLWRTILYHGLTANTADDVMALINAGHLQHDAAQLVEPVKFSTWRIYTQRFRKALLPLVEDPKRHAGRLMHINEPRKPQSGRPQMSEKDRAGFRLAIEAVGTLHPPIAFNADTLLTREVWPRVATAMHSLGRVRGISVRTVDAHIEDAKRVLAKQATHPVPARLPKTIPAPMPVQPKWARLPSRVPSLPAAICAEVNELLNLRGYTQNAKRSMVAELGKAYVAGVKAGILHGEPTLDRIVVYGTSHISGRTHIDANRMCEIIRLCAHPQYRAFLEALRQVGLAKAEDPTSQLFTATRGELPPSAITREWAWTHERSLEPDPRKTFSKAIDQLDALREIEGLAAFLPNERIGPLQASVLRSGKRHQHACYPLPRQVESDAAALGLDPDSVDCLEMMAGLHSLYEAAMNSGVVQPDEAITCADLLCSATIDAITRSGVISAVAIRTARNRTKMLQPDERYATPKHRWRTLHTQVKAAGEHKPRLDGTGERIPGFYVVRNEALEDDLGPEALTSIWANRVIARAGDDRTRWSSFRQGLRLLQAWRETSGIEERLLPPDRFEDDLISAERPRAVRVSRDPDLHIP